MCSAGTRDTTGRDRLTQPRISRSMATTMRGSACARSSHGWWCRTMMLPPSSGNCRIPCAGRWIGRRRMSRTAPRTRRQDALQNRRDPDYRAVMRPFIALRRRFFSRGLLVAGALLAASSAHAQHSGGPPGQDLAAALGGGWTRSGACDQPVPFRLAGRTLLVVGTDGKIDTQRVLERRATGIARETTASAHGNPIGMRWVYEVVAPGQLSLTDQRGQSATFQRCRPPIAATASPASFCAGCSPSMSTAPTPACLSPARQGCTPS